MKEKTINSLKIAGAVFLFGMGIYFELLLLTIITNYAIFDNGQKETVVRLLCGFLPFVAGVQLSIIGINPINIATLFRK